MTEKTPTAARKPRADAVRNREKILEVASAAFEQDGVNISMDAIARQAGVGAGTLYRNFPNRSALIAAVLETRGVQAPESAADSLARGESALEALRAWLDATAKWFQTYEGLTDPMRQAVEEATSPLGMACHNVIAQLDQLLAAAQQEGNVRPGVTGRDLYLATLGMAWAAQHSDNPDALYDLLARGWLTLSAEN
ncbi:TetR/AcrR family transcriptional regulator [Rothia nasisuis]|uniref:TetR/AcrR family transcriptional regulator n=1 Tax=Rothia nasisuis TaxID=2109647 RepID=UPI001F337C81|nr:TetR/AcrR family transcriptional regulator [Rothia nasisuis]